MIRACPPILFVRDRWMWVYCVDGRSMTPTLNPQDSFFDRHLRDYVLVHKNAEFRNGDVEELTTPELHILLRGLAKCCTPSTTINKFAKN